MLTRTVCAVGCLVAVLAIALEAPVGAEARAGTKLTGKTKQGRTIVLRLANGSVHLQRFSISLRCRDGSLLIDQESGFEPVKLGGGGSFRSTQVGSTDEVTFRGKARGNRVKGWVRVTDRVGKIKCNSGKVRFNAQAGRKRG